MKPMIMAEACCNHMGSLEIALEMIDVASSYCKVDVVKFQKRNVKENLSAERYSGPHPEPQNSFGPTYGAHREALEFDISIHAKLKEHCEKKGLIYAVSVFDLTSAIQCAELGSKIIKIPSALNNNYEILGHLCDKFEGDIHISTGMTTSDELRDLMDYLDSKGRVNDVVLYACTSSYPCRFEDLHLNHIRNLKDRFAGDLKAVGFSGHHNGIAADIAALALGATWFERHFTLDRTWKGTDQAASLEPDGLRKLVRDLNNVTLALTDRPSGILEGEGFNRHFHKDNRGLK
jgi:N-acetylneuraminate synthase